MPSPTSFPFKLLSRNLIVSNGALGVILSGFFFEASPDSRLLECATLPAELRFFQVAASANPRRTYLTVFVFSNDKRNKLLHVDEELAKKIIGFLSDSGYITHMTRRPWAGTTVTLVGKKGSNVSSRFHTLFNRYKVVVMDFPSGSTIEDFLGTILNDFEKIEQKGLQATNQQADSGPDLNSLPLSEKRIRLQDGMTSNVRQETIFANQLLQIPGVTENIAQSIARRFGRPTKLLEHVAAGQSLVDISFTSARGDQKRINSRIQGSLVRLYGQGIPFDDLIR